MSIFKVKLKPLISMKTSCNDRRKYTIPPPPKNSINRYNKTVSARIESSMLDELKSLLIQRYGIKNVPMTKVSCVIRIAIMKKVRELKERKNS